MLLADVVVNVLPCPWIGLRLPCGCSEFLRVEAGEIGLSRCHGWYCQFLSWSLARERERERGWGVAASFKPVPRPSSPQLPPLHSLRAATCTSHFTLHSSNTLLVSTLTHPRPTPIPTPENATIALRNIPRLILTNSN